MIRAYIRENLPMDSLEITLIQGSDGTPRRIMGMVDPAAGIFRWEDLPEDSRHDVTPTLHLGDDEARALLEALVRHYNGAEDTRALRRDYDAERMRVDTLTSALMNVTQMLATPSAVR